MPLFLSLAAAIGFSVATLFTGAPDRQSNLEMQEDVRIQASVEEDESVFDRFKALFESDENTVEAESKEEIELSAESELSQ